MHKLIHMKIDFERLHSYDTVYITPTISFYYNKDLKGCFSIELAFWRCCLEINVDLRG